jgi:hypothetical protein
MFMIFTVSLNSIVIILHDIVYVSAVNVFYLSCFSCVELTI